jgi:hypothetical protein
MYQPKKSVSSHSMLKKLFLRYKYLKPYVCSQVAIANGPAVVQVQVLVGPNPLWPNQRLEREQEGKQRRIVIFTF